MKTTIDIPDALADEARQLARDTGSTLRELVVSGLRHEVLARRAPVVVDFVFPTFGGRGLAVELEADDVIAHSYGLPSARGSA